MTRFLALVALFSRYTHQAFACSCFCALDGNAWASDRLEERIAALITPISSRIVIAEPNMPSERPNRNRLSTEYLVLEDFGQRLGPTITALTAELGRSCFVDHQFEQAYYVQLHRLPDGQYRLDSCSCLPPYFAAKDYMVNGQDYWLQDIYDCWDAESDGHDKSKTCQVYEDKAREFNDPRNPEFIQSKLKA